MRLRIRPPRPATTPHELGPGARPRRRTPLSRTARPDPAGIRRPEPSRVPHDSGRPEPEAGGSPPPRGIGTRPPTRPPQAGRYVCSDGWEYGRRPGACPPVARPACASPGAAGSGCVVPAGLLSGVRCRDLPVISRRVGKLSPGRAESQSIFPLDSWRRPPESANPRTGRWKKTVARKRRPEAPLQQWSGSPCRGTRSRQESADRLHARSQPRHLAGCRVLVEHAL